MMGQWVKMRQPQDSETSPEVVQTGYLRGFARENPVACILPPRPNPTASLPLRVSVTADHSQL
jgi:hypothetical protein